MDATTLGNSNDDYASSVVHRARAQEQRDLRVNVPAVLFKFGLASCAAATIGAVNLIAAASQLAEGVAALARPVASAALAGAFFGGLGTIGAGFWMADARAPLRRATKVTILCLASVPLAVAVGVAGVDCTKLVFNILAANNR